MGRRGEMADHSVSNGGSHGACGLAVLAVGVLGGLLPQTTGDAAYKLGFYLMRPWDGSALSQGHGMHYQPSMEGRNAVITGGTEGVGFQAVKWFHALGANVVLSGRTKASASAAAAMSHNATEGRGICVGFAMDLADFESVRSFASDAGEKLPELNYLVLNAGTSHDNKATAGPGEWITATGHNMVFAANHLGHFLLAALLVPSLKQGGTIVVVSSLTAWWGNPAALLQAKANPWKTATEREAARPYATSKLANLCFARSLRRKLDAKGIAVVAMTPGEVAIDTHRNDEMAHGVSEELGGDKLFESCFVTHPVPDFVYPYWFPAAVFGRSTSQEDSELRHRNMAYFHRPERLQTLDYNLHGSVGPECDLALQEELWKWSREALNLQAEYDTVAPWLGPRSS